MVSIEYGGGPSIEQRRAFCNPPAGSHIPGYMGFVPQVQFETGKTFARETHEITKKIPYYKGPRDASVKHIQPDVGPSKDCENRLLFRDEVVRKKLPLPTGDNKYTEKMIPGYSGDIPHWPYKFGSTYRQTCDDAVDEFIVNYERNQTKMAHLERMAGMFPRLRAIAGDPRVRDHMNLWTDEMLHTGKGPLRETHRELLEPAMPGYTGYVPRQFNTELGLTGRYHAATKKCWESFKSETDNHFHKLATPMTVDKNNTYTVMDAKPLKVTVPSEPIYSRRIFVQDGMRPGYTGHVHGGNSIDGYTYGDTSRMLEVCQHAFPCYGDYIKNVDLAV